MHSPTPPIRARRAASTAAVVAICLLGAGLSAPAYANVGGTDLVISEAYVNGGSGGASFNNKFIELYNPTSAPISLAGDTLQYRAPTSTVTPSGSQVFALSGTVAAHDHFLIQLPTNAPTGTTNGALLPTPDLVSSVNPGAGGGTLFIARSSTGVQPGDASVIDRIGWGTSNAPEGGTGHAATGNSVALSYQRATTGKDTDDNAADFLAAPPTPQASGSATPPDPEPGTDTDVAIAQIQGDGDTSPYVGRTVTTEGVVTADYRTGGFSGFYLATGGSGGTPAQDKTPGQSDAVFVFGSTAAGQVNVGDSVSVTGTVAEFKGTTELTSPVVTSLAAPLDPVQPGILSWSELTTEAQKEAHEGELIAPQGSFTVTDNYDANWYGSFTLAAGTSPLRQPTDVGAPGSPEAAAVVADNAARTITLDDGASVSYNSASNTGKPLPWLDATHAVSIGATVTFHQPVVLEYRNSLWNLQPTAQVEGDGASVATFGDQRAANERPASTGGDARLATFNVENYFPTTGAEYVGNGLGSCTYYNDRAGNHITVNRCSTSTGAPGPRGAADDENFLRQQQKIVVGINRLGASIVSLEEIENSVKFGEPRDAALAGLVDALNAAAGSTVWAYVPSPAADALPSVDEQDVIRTAFIYKPGVVTPVGTSSVLTGTKSFSIARQPLAQGFKKANTSDAEAFLVVANHWKSKGSGAPLYPGDVENTAPASNQGSFNETRVHEAEDTAAFADEVAARLGTDRIFLLGDLNAYTHEDPLHVLYEKGYTDLASTFAEGEHSYSFDGLQGSLDHVLANEAALKMVTGADVWQINAQESVAYNYSRYNYNATLLFDGTTPFAASDHDPEVVGVNLPTPASWQQNAVYRAGDLVTFDGAIWRARYYTQGDTPGASKKIVWEQLATAPDGAVQWTATRVFDTGDVVEYDGVTYVAQWWTQGDAPGAALKKQPWKVVG